MDHAKQNFTCESVMGGKDLFYANKMVYHDLIETQLDWTVYLKTQSVSIPRETAVCLLMITSDYLITSDYTWLLV